MLNIKNRRFEKITKYNFGCLQKAKKMFDLFNKSNTKCDL